MKKEVITITEPSPPDEGKRGSLNPKLSITVRHQSGKAMDITFRTDASGEWKDIATFAKVKSGTYSVTPADMIRRGEVYHWQVVAADGKNTATKSFSFDLVYHFGSGREIIMHSDCWKYGIIKHGWEKGRFFVTTQRGTWASYDIDKGWDKTFQRLFKEKGYPTGDPSPQLDDGGNLGHPFWGYWDGMYHVLGKNNPGWKAASSRTFEGFQKMIEQDDAKDLGIKTQQQDWPEGTAYTFSDDRAWILAIDFDAPNSRSNVKYWEWTKAGGWKDAVIVGPIAAPHTGNPALVRHNRNLWYLFVAEGPSSASDPTTTATLKYFKSTDAGKTWGALQDTGIPAHGLWSRLSFARYGNHYYVFVSKDTNTYIYYSKDLEHWDKRREVAMGMWGKPHGTLLHQSALISVVAAGYGYIDDEIGIITTVPEMISAPLVPTEASPASGSVLDAGATGTELSVQVHGPQTYDVAFYWEDGTFIGEDKLLLEGETARVNATGLAPGKEYKWYAIARGALLEYSGAEPDTTSDEKRSEFCSFTLAK